MIAVFGESLPRITCQEIRQAFRLRQDGTPVDVWVFLNRQLRRRRHMDFISRIKRQFHEQVVFAQYESELDFQATLFTTVTPYLVRRLVQAPIPLGEPS